MITEKFSAFERIPKYVPTGKEYRCSRKEYHQSTELYSDMQYMLLFLITDCLCSDKRITKFQYEVHIGEYQVDKTILTYILTRNTGTKVLIRKLTEVVKKKS